MDVFNSGSHHEHPQKALPIAGRPDTKYSSPADVDSLLSKELHQLSFQDRTNLQEEIHGVRNAAPEETPQVIEAGLAKLKEELHAIPLDKKLAFSRACSLPQSHVHTSKFLLTFLRADLYNAKEAAQRVVSYLDMMLDFYGPVSLERPIGLGDLGDPELKVLRSGQIQLLPFRDRSGRRIMTFVSNMGFSFPVRAKFKAISYLLSVAVEDDETQKKGMVVLMCPGEEAANSFLKVPDAEEGKGFDRMTKSAPTRTIAAHICFPDSPLFQMFKSMLMFWSGKNQRTRSRFYSGSNIETRYQLMGFGIPVDLIPLTDSGSVKKKQITQWIKIRKAIEDPSVVEGIVVECPLSCDVLFKSGSNSLSHPGNVFFRNLIETNFHEHNSTKSSGLKVTLSWKIVDEVIVVKGGRFLEWDKRGWWMVIEDRAQMRAKVATSLRDFKKQIHAYQNRQTFMSSTFDFERQDGKKRKRIEYRMSDSVLCKPFR